MLPSPTVGPLLLLAGLLLLPVLASAIAVLVLVRMPSDHFTATQTRAATRARSGAFAGAGVFLRNLLGASLVVVGVVMSVPAVPGPGILIIFAGILLLNFPGKRKLLLRLVSRPRVLRSINRMRAKCSRPPLAVD